MGDIGSGRAGWLGVLFFCFLVCGCATVYAPEKADPSKLGSSGMVVFSTGLVEQCTMGVNLHFWSNNGTSTFAQVSNPILKSDFADHFGYVNALALKPGRYDVFPDGQAGVNMTNIPHAFITVEAGKIVYIGEFFIDSPCRKFMAFHWPVDSHFVDRFDRDVAVLKAKNPAFGNVAIEKHILQFEVVTPN